MFRVAAPMHCVFPSVSLENVMHCIVLYWPYNAGTTLHNSESVRDVFDDYVQSWCFFLHNVSVTDRRTDGKTDSMTVALSRGYRYSV